jgi:phosphate starvation-inducible PhoH-like protein
MARVFPRRARDKGMADVTTADVEVSDTGLLLRLSGPNASHLRRLGAELDVDLGLRGDTIRIQGADDDVALTQRVIADLLEVLDRGNDLSEVEIGRAARTMRANPEMRLTDLFEDVILLSSRQKVIAPKGVTQQAYINAIRDFDIVFGVGPAGTGKTYLAMAMAVRALQQKRVKRIILTRPAVEAGEKLGFLPGDLAEKVNPYLRPLYDALHDMMDFDKAQALISRGTIEVAPLAFMRGRTLNDSFVILDEAQNTKPEQMKMFLTRLGFESRAVITGDLTQVDLPVGARPGLQDALDLLGNVDGIRVIRFTDADVVRHPLVQKIVRAYDERDARRANEAKREEEARDGEEHDGPARDDDEGGEPDDAG